MSASTTNIFFISADFQKKHLEQILKKQTNTKHKRKTI